MDELRIPKRRVSVDFRLLARSEPQRLTLFLGEYAADHPGPERLSDVLNGSADFLPALDEARQKTVFLHRPGVLLARVAADEEPGEAISEAVTPTEHEVQCQLVDGTVVTGVVAYMLRPDRSRMNDYLNAAPTFLRLVEKEGVVLVNKRHLVQVESVG